MTRVWFAALVVTACGGNNAHPPDAIAIDAPAVDAPPGYSMLISRMWSLPAGDQGYKCTRLQIQQDMWINGFRALSPTGTHHETLTVAPTASGPVGDYDCTPNTNDPELTFAAGIGTDDMELPAGVAVHFTAGEYINLNLHLFNATDGALTEQSGVMVRPIPAATVVHEADMAFAGTMTIDIPNDGQPHTAQGGCLAPAGGWHVMNLWPHMHQTATHQSFIVTHNQIANPMLDVAFDYEAQKNYPMGDVLVNAGDNIQVTCTYVNTTAINPITYGISDTEEMCFTGMYKYPTGNDLYACTN